MPTRKRDRAPPDTTTAATPAAAAATPASAAATPEVAVVEEEEEISVSITLKLLLAYMVLYWLRIESNTTLTKCLPHQRGELCTICLRSCRKNEFIRVLSCCTHFFHMRCIEEWLKTSGSCPICRQEA